MKKFVSKISKILSVFALAVLFVFTDTQTVGAEPSSIKLGDATRLPGYIAGTRFYFKTNQNGGYVYCVDRHKRTAKNIKANLVSTMNAGVAYILENGYPNKSITGNKQKDYYITQSAVWWYLDDTTGSSNLDKSFKSTGSDNYGLRKYVKNLVNGAKKAKSKGYETASVNLKTSSSKMTLSKDGKYYVSKTINANAKNINGKYTVTIASAPSGTIITDVNGNKKTKFSSNEKFMIKVPASKIAEGKTVSVKVKVKATGKVQKAYKYQPTDGSMQPVVTLYPVTKNVSDTIKVTATKPKEEKEGKVIIKKVDKETGKVVAGATLVVKDSNGNVVKTFISSESGNTFENVKAGKYTVEETKAPAGYELTSEKVSFTVTGEDSKSVEVKVYNEQIKSNVVIKKVDKETGEVIAGATLVVKDSEGNVVKTFISSESGNTFENVKPGNYTVEETKAPAGYELTSEKVSFTVSSDKSTTVEVKVYNEKEEQEGNVIIKKVDKETGEVIAGAILVVKDSEGNVVKTITSSESGNEINDLKAGEYTVEETKAPAGYELTSEKVPFTVTGKDSKTVEVKVYNKKTQTKKVIINKVDKSTGNNVAGATLVVKDSNGNVIKTFKSTTTGYEISNLSNGTYTVEETEAPAGYKLTSEKVSFTISDENTSVSVSIYNEPESPIVTISKVNSVTGKFVAGAEILITNEAGEEVARFTSTDSAYILKDLAYGTYTVEEVTAPEGYFLNEEKQTFTIDASHLSAQVTIKNVPKTCENGGIDENECSVDVPNTGSSSTLFSILGIAIIGMGVGYVYKNNKQSI